MKLKTILPTLLALVALIGLTTDVMARGGDAGGGARPPSPGNRGAPDRADRGDKGDKNDKGDKRKDRKKKDDRAKDRRKHKDRVKDKIRKRCHDHARDGSRRDMVTDAVNRFGR